MTDKRIKLIIAGNYQQFRDYLNERNLFPSSEIKYCSRMQDILGHRNAEIILTGEYWLNPLYDYMVDTRRC